MAVPLQEALRSVVTTRTRLQVELRIDGEPLTVRAADGEVTVRIGTDDTAALVLATHYESLLASGEGRLSPARFFRDHMKIERGSARDARAFVRLLERAFAGTEPT